MATRFVRYSTASSRTGELLTINSNAARRSRYEKMEVAFGKILSTDYAANDVLVFSEIPCKDIIRASFTSVNSSLATIKTEVRYGASSFNITHALADSGTTQDIYYTVDYIRGTGKIDDGTTQAGEGQLLKLTVTS